MSYTVYDRILESYKVSYNRDLINIDPAIESSNEVNFVGIKKVYHSLNTIDSKFSSWKRKIQKEVGKIESEVKNIAKLHQLAREDQLEYNSSEIKRIINDTDIDIDDAIVEVGELTDKNYRLQRGSRDGIMIPAESLKLINTGIKECNVAVERLCTACQRINTAIETLPSNYNSVFTTLDEYYHDDWKYSTKSSLYELQKTIKNIDDTNFDVDDNTALVPVSTENIRSRANDIIDTHFIGKANEDKEPTSITVLKLINGGKYILEDIMHGETMSGDEYVDSMLPQFATKLYTAIYDISEAYKTLISYESRLVYMMILSGRN